MQVTLKVQRFDPESPKPEPFWQEFKVEIEPHFTVLDTLIKVREEMDGSLALRCSCRSSICGSCAMRINGHATLACKTKVAGVSTPTGQVTVAPAGNMPVIKDLVVDMQSFWDKVRAVKPWLQPTGPAPEKEYLASNEAMNHLSGVMACIMCGACVSDCTVLEVDKNFLGPAALAKAYRFVADPRDAASVERLRALNTYGGVWDCTRCFECVEVCPKGIAPMARIMALRDRAMEAGYNNTYGARHTEAFAKLVEHSGQLDELRLPLMTFGMTNVPKLLGLLPVGLQAMRKGKMPPVFHKPLPKKDLDSVQRIARKAEALRQGEKAQAK
ncbi:MAG: succinate dehydrogenase iron-sulfur subunit [Chloroflexi bacterium]|nr:succinate dehydrogenase iron-sulfur subunit [Chloroflexota bacterium]